MSSTHQVAIDKLTGCGLKPSVQRVAILEYLLTHFTHPTVEDVYKGLCEKIPTLSKTTVYNTLRLFYEHDVALMLTLDEHRVCYDGNTHPHAHFMCKRCGRIFDLMDEPVPVLEGHKVVEGHVVDDIQLYYKGICADCVGKEAANER